jgi:hypothetical protein
MFYERTRQAVVSSFFLHSVVVLISSRCFAMVIDASSFTAEVFT